MRTFRYALLALLPLLSLPSPTTAEGQAAVPSDHVPRFEEAPCPFERPRELVARTRCGWLVVPENRDVPAGRRLRLAVAVVKSERARPLSDPIVFVNGGPGVATVANVPRLTPVFGHVLADRDMIFYDQRGVGLSEPSFCRSLDTLMLRLPLQGLTPGGTRERMRDGFTRCAAEMRAQGVDPAQYNSAVSALDLRDLRVALGVREWNIWTGSYGARLTLEALRSAPDGVRSVVMDSPDPPGLVLGLRQSVNMVTVLERTFARCASDDACAAAFPDAERRFWESIDALEQEPLVLRGVGDVDSITVTGKLFADAVFQGLYRAEFHAVLPLLVREIARPNRPVLEAVAGSLLAAPGRLSHGLHFTVECSERLPGGAAAIRPNAPDARVARLERLELGGNLDGVCDALHDHRAEPAFASPVASDRPVLIFAGALDPVTPLANAHFTAATLPRAQVVEIPGGGHGASPRFACTTRLTRDFLANPVATLDAACADSIRPSPFITEVRLTPGVARVASSLTSGAWLPKVGAAAALLILLAGALGWPIAAIWRRLLRRSPRAVSGLDRSARFLAGGMSVLALGFFAALGAIVAQAAGRNPFLLALGVPAGAAPLLRVPWLLLVGSVLLLSMTVMAWRRRIWTNGERLRFAVLAVTHALVTATVVTVGLV